MRKAEFGKSQINKVLGNLNKQILGINSRTVAGVSEGLTIIRNGAIDRTPVDTGNLRSSTYQEVNKGSLGIQGETGFQAKYAVYVHEMLDNFHATGEAKFLERSVIANSPLVYDAIRRRAKVNG